MSPISRSGYATHHRNGSTRAYRQARASTLEHATHCALCHQPLTGPLEAHHTHAYADNGHGPLQATHQACNRQHGRT